MESKGASGSKKLPSFPDSSLHLLPQLPMVRAKPKWQDAKPSFVLLGQTENIDHGVSTRITRETLRGSMQLSQRVRSTARVTEFIKQCVKSKKDREQLRRTLVSIFTSFSEPLCYADGGGVILEETTPIRIEMFRLV